jgi:hypothetical protein
MQTRRKAPRARPAKAAAKEAVRKPADDFVSVARRLGFDEDKGRFEAKLAKIAKATPSEGKRRS